MNNIKLLINIFESKKRIDGGQYNLKISNTIENLSIEELGELIARLYSINFKIYDSSGICFKKKDEDIMINYKKDIEDNFEIINIKILTYKGYDRKKGIDFIEYCI